MSSAAYLPHKRAFNRVLFVLNFLFFFLLLFPYQASADVSSCEVTMSPSTTTRDTSTVFTFSIDSYSALDNPVWVKITRPSGNYTITNGTATNWSPSSNANDVTFTAGSPTLATSFSVYATTANSDVGAETWTISMSESAGGANAKNCTGSLSTSINGSSSVSPTPTPTSTPVPDTSAPVISNVTISGISDTTAKVSWETNESASALLSYGKSTSYGDTKTSSDLKTSHSFDLTGLASNTTYHGQIKSTDAANNQATSSDFTFATSSNTTTVTVTVETIVTPTPTATPLPDTTKPKVTLKTQLDKVFKNTPRIEGEASDNNALGTLEYSVDDGQNWAKIDQVDNPGSKKSNFSFIPYGLGDGDYLVKVRIKDTSNNEVVTASQKMIIDRLPPAVGGALFSIGPQILQTSSEGMLVSLAGLTSKLTFSAVGGPTSIMLNLKSLGGSQEIPLTQNIQTRLWSGNIVFPQPGIYTLEAASVDGAQNHTERDLQTIVVLPNGVISDPIGPVIGAQLSVFYFDAQYQQFRLWSAGQYGQENPQRSDELGRYQLLLPPGTYYIQITAAGVVPLKTNIFTLEQSTPITQDFLLRKKKGFQIGNLLVPFPDFGQNDVMMNMESISTRKDSEHELVGKEFPNFNFDGIDKNSLTGQPIVISVMSTWLPQLAQQLEALETAKEQEDVESLVIMSQNSSASVNVFAKRGGYGIPMIADPDGILIEPLHVTSLPTHYFLDRRGIVTRVMTGVLSTDELVKGREH